MSRAVRAQKLRSRPHLAETETLLHPAGGEARIAAPQLAIISVHFWFSQSAFDV